jgi:tetratricopeptide (TPR) repeat protein
MQWNTRFDRAVVGIILSFVGLLFVLNLVKPDPLMLPMLRVNQNNPKAYFQRGNRYLATDPGSAITYYSEAIQLNPAYTDAYYQRSLAYQRVGNATDALADLDQAIALDPASALYHLARGNLYDQAGQPDRAIADYTTAIRLDPTSAAAYFNRAGTLYDMGRMGAALADYRVFFSLYSIPDQVTAIATQRVESITGAPAVADQTGYPTDLFSGLRDAVAQIQANLRR